MTLLLSNSLIKSTTALKKMQLQIILKCFTQSSEQSLMGLYYIFFTYWKNVEVLLYTFVLLIHAAQTLVFNQLCKYQQEMILNSWVSFCLDVFTNVCFFQILYFSNSSIVATHLRGITRWRTLLVSRSSVSMAFKIHHW